MRLKSFILKITLFFAAFVVIFYIPYLAAEESEFRRQFIENYKKDSFYAQSGLVKKNKDTIVSEIDALINEAMMPEKNFQERMYLLDIANSMASMNIHWNNGSEDVLNRVEKLQKQEFEKEKKKTEEIERLKEAEKVPGNFILSTYKDEMAKHGLSPVIYPHWIHRSFFRCKVCHEPIFIMKRGSNNITRTSILEGKHCGACHNGKISFDANAQENCTRCHLFGKPESNPLMDLSYYNHDKFKEIASRIGSEWNPEKLPGGKLPLDKLGFINWVELDKIKAFNPRSALDGTPDTEGVRDTSILFETSVTFLNNVLFSHRIHSTWVRCSLCHPDIFKPELGANKVKMIEMKDGKSCGRCHGRVAFTYSNCLRCHNQPRENIPQGALINRAGSSAPAQ